MRLNEILVLPKAGRYARPRDPGASLVHVYGDFMSDDVISGGTELRGATPAVLIDVDNGVWLVNNARSHPDKPLLYMNDRLQEDQTYAYNPAALLGDAAGNVHTVAVITIDPSIVGLVLQNDFSVRMKGAVDENGALITNPITAIQHFFTTFGHWVSTDFDAVSCNQARDIADALGLPVHWAFLDDRSYKQHLSDILYHYHGNHTTNLASQLSITLDQDQFVPSEQIFAFLDANTHVEGLSPSDEVEWDLDKRNLGNALQCSYQYSWATQDYGQFAERTALASIQRYGVQTKSLSLPGIRTEHHLNMWTTLWLNRYALLPAIVRFPLRTLIHLGLQPTTYHTFTWSDGPNAHGLGWTDRILKVLNTGLEFQAYGQPLECFDTGLTFLRPTYLVLLDQEGGTWYLRIRPEGTLELTSFVSAEVAMLTAPQHWIARQSQDDTTWYIYPTPEGTLAVETTEPSVGTGTTESLTFVDRRSHPWAIQAMNTGAIRLTDLI